MHHLFFMKATRKIACPFTHFSSYMFDEKLFRNRVVRRSLEAMKCKKETLSYSFSLLYLAVTVKLDVCDKGIKYCCITSNRLEP